MRISLSLGIGATGGSPAGSPLFTDISGLRADYDASRETSTAQMTDFSGGGRHATQSDADKRPLRTASGFGSNSRAYWAGTNPRFWLPPTSIVSGAAALHIFAVMQAGSVTSGGLHDWGSSSDATETPYYSVIYEDAGNGTRRSSSNIGTTLNASPVIYEVLSAANKYRIRVNGSDVYTNGTNTVAFATQPVIGGGGTYNSGTNTTTSFFNGGKWSRYLVFNEDLDATGDDVTVRARLQAWFGTA